jgi:hypothetical protein
MRIATLLWRCERLEEQGRDTTEQQRLLNQTMRTIGWKGAPVPRVTLRSMRTAAGQFGLALMRPALCSTAAFRPVCSGAKPTWR